MKNLYLLGACLFLLFSCKKDTSPGTKTEDKKYKTLKINVSGFDQNYSPLETTGKKKPADIFTYTPPVDSLILIVTDLNYNILAIQGANKSTANYGMFEKTVLAKNGYHAMIIGGDRNIILDQNLTFGFQNHQWADTYYGSTNFTDEVYEITQTIRCYRQTAQLILNLEDAIPADVKKITVSYNDTTSISLADGLRNGSSIRETSVNITPADAGKSNFRIVMNTLNNITPFTVTIKYYKSDPEVPAATKVVDNVLCKTNVRTILSGRLFDNEPGSTSNSNFSVKIDPNWGNEVTTHF